jgi:hypothetical protein
MRRRRTSRWACETELGRPTSFALIHPLLPFPPPCALSAINTHVIVQIMYSKQIKLMCSKQTDRRSLRAHSPGRARARLLATAVHAVFKKRRPKA